MYGLVRWSQCYDQKQTLGKDAMKLVNYYECDAQGLNSRRPECLDAGIKGYPFFSTAETRNPRERK